MNDVTAVNAPVIDITGAEIIFTGRRLPAPLHIRDLVDLLGPPDRIVPGTPPAPVKHKNNEAYVYDRLGTYWLREHNSEDIVSLAVVFRQSNGPIPVPFMPVSPYCGSIELPGLTVTSQTRDADLVNALRGAQNKQAIGNIAGAYLGHRHISFISTKNSKVGVSAGQGNLACVFISLRDLRGDMKRGD